MKCAWKGAMTTLLTAGWICYGLEVLVLFGLLLAKGSSEASGDAIGRGVAMVLGMFLLPAGALLVWGTMSGNVYGVRGGAGMACFPFAVALVLAAPKLVPNVGSMTQEMGLGRFADSRLTALAKALAAEDVAKVQALVRAGGIDWTARDKRGYTLLGLAVKRCAEGSATAANYEGLKVLLAAGAPLAQDVLSAADGKENLIPAASGGGPELLTILLAAGGDANGRNRAGVPVIFETMYRPAHFRLLVEHGADVNAVDREWMNPGQSLLMRLVHEQQWAEAEYLLGKRPDLGHKADNGTTVATLLGVAPGGEAAAIAAKARR